MGEVGPVYRPSGGKPELRMRSGTADYPATTTARWLDDTPGDFPYVPEGGVHAFRKESGEPASMLLLFPPGAPREGYFEGLPGIGQLSDAERAEFFRRHDTCWLRRLSSGGAP